jgi:hypothetical protein
VQTANAEAQHRSAHRQIHHIERLSAVVGADTTQRQQFVQPDAGLIEKTFEVACMFTQQLGREPVEPGFYGGVSGEKISGSCCPPCLPEREARAPHIGSRPLENGEGGMTLVQVTDLDRGGERLDRPPARDPEDDLLQNADFSPGVVEFAGDAAVGGAVDRVVGVKQIQCDASDLRLPDAQRDVSPGQVERDAEPRSVRALRRLDRHRTGVIERISLMLHPGGVDDLSEISLLIEQTDADYG